MDKIVRRLKQFYIRWKYRRYGWRGQYASWREAVAASEGYDSGKILEKVRAAAIAVRNGEAVYERDSLLSDKIEYSWPLLAHLLWIAAQQKNHLALIDFGGSLGTTWYQNRFYLSHIPGLQWSVVEQPNYVAVGKREMSNTQLQFFDDIAAAKQARGPHQVLLLSCVLPYLESPFTFIRDLLGEAIPYIIIDNTYFNNCAGSRLTIQKVPPVYYEASYPAWFLDYDEVKSLFTGSYTLIAEYENEQWLYLDGQRINYRGMVWRLNDKTNIT